MSLLSRITFWTDLRDLSDGQRADTAWWITWYKAHRDELSGLVYSNTASDPLDGKGWAAFQPWTGKRGYLFAFRQADGPDTQAIKLYGLAAKRDYTVTNVKTGDTLGTFSGKALMSGGVPVTLPSAFSAAVLEIAPGAAPTSGRSPRR